MIIGTTLMINLRKKKFYSLITKGQYRAALVIIEENKGISKIKLYKEFGLKSLRFRRWIRWLRTFFKVKLYKLPEYL